MPEEEDDFQKKLERVETLIQQIQASGDTAVQASAQELVQVLLELHAKGLERVLDIVWEEGEAGKRLLHEELPDDDLVSSLLILHGLHPLGLEARVEEALEEVRPYMHSHGGNVELLGVENGVVHLRLGGSCDGCQASKVTLKYAVEDAIYETAPEVNDVEAIGVPDEDEEDGVDDSFIPLEQVSDSASSTNGVEGRSSGRQYSEQDPGEWHRVAGLDDLGEGTARAKDVAGRSILFFRRDSTLYAYANECPSCHQSLTDAQVDGAILICFHCDQAFDGVQAGRGLGEADVQLDPIPLLREGGDVTVALSEAVA